MLQNVYVLTKRDLQGELYLAKDPKRAELPICLSKAQAEYLLNFAESRLPCALGEEFVLLQGSVDITEVGNSYDLMKLVVDRCDLSSWEVVAQKKAEDPRSTNYRNKVVQDLYAARERILQSRGDSNQAACG